MVCGGFCEERKPAAGGWEHLLTDAHAHIGSMAEVEERLNSRIPSMVSAGYRRGRETGRYLQAEGV